MAPLLSKEGRLFTDWYRYREYSRLLVYRRRKVLVYWKRLEARSTVRVPCVNRNLSKVAKVSTEPSRKLNNPECFQLWLTRQRTFLTKKLTPSLVLRYVDSSKNIREEFSGARHRWEETTGNAIKELITNSVRDLGFTMDNRMMVLGTWLVGTLVY